MYLTNPCKASLEIEHYNFLFASSSGGPSSQLFTQVVQQKKKYFKMNHKSIFETVLKDKLDNSYVGGGLRGQKSILRAVQMVPWHKKKICKLFEASSCLNFQ